MWCTRWFLPLLLLPLPTAPPYFLVLFIFSLTIHAKPCIYCIVLLTTLLVSSCYWQPFPIDSPLITPWSENITTFAEAINASLPSNFTTPLPTVMRAVDRCWCDFSGSFFEPFNVTHWEFLSVQKVRQELQRQQRLDDMAVSTQSTSEQEIQQKGISDSLHSPPEIEQPPPSSGYFWALFRRHTRKKTEEYQSVSVEGPASAVLAQHPKTAVPPSHTSTFAADLTPSFTGSDSSIPMRTPSLEYDLRPYGFGIIVDFGWSR